jgi:hypothetical protein
VNRLLLFVSNKTDLDPVPGLRTLVNDQFLGRRKPGLRTSEMGAPKLRRNERNLPMSSQRGDDGCRKA